MLVTNCKDRSTSALSPGRECQSHLCYQHWALGAGIYVVCVEFDQQEQYTKF